MSNLTGFFERFQHLFRPRAHGDVLGEIHPADYPARIDEKLCRTRDVGALGPRSSMQHIVSPNYFRLRVRQECVGVAQFLALASIDLRRVHTNGDDLNPARFKFRKSLLKTPQLGVT
jgi:hypothetical protein